MTPEEQDVLVIGNTLEETAYHEAGHIVVAAVLGLGMRPKGITIWEAANDVMDGLAGYWDDETDWEKNLQAVRAGQIANGENFRSLTPREQSQTTITSSRLSENTSQEVSPAIYGKASARRPTLCLMLIGVL